MCFGEGPSQSRSERHREGRYGGPIPIQDRAVFDLQRAFSRSNHSHIIRNADKAGDTYSVKNERQRSLCSWDPIQPGQRVDWYAEYVARHAPLSTSWLEKPCKATSSAVQAENEARGMGLLKSPSQSTVVAPLNDGGLCLWNLGREDDYEDSAAGKILARSDSGVLLSSSKTSDEAGSYSKTIPGNNPVECVSIDQSTAKAYIAVDHTLSEVDLNTLRVTHRVEYSNLLSVLSEGGTHPNPLVVGTTTSLHLYDPRTGQPSSRTEDSARLENAIQAPLKAEWENRLYSGDDTFANLEPLPLSVIHLNNHIHVGGRFPSILSYDLRCFPKTTSNIYSGARISSLAALASSSNDTSSSSATLAAAGEYKGKGSLELYQLPSHPLSSSKDHPPVIRNRTSASRSKILSLVPHGTRLLFSDSDGQLKWVERDGSTLVRRWGMGDCSTTTAQRTQYPVNTIFNLRPDPGQVARKLLTVDEGERSEIVIWSGEDVRVMGYGKRPRFGRGRVKKGSRISGEGEDEDEGEDMVDGQSREERKFDYMMREALRRQADEVRVFRGMGFGGMA